MSALINSIMKLGGSPLGLCATAGAVLSLTACADVARAPGDPAAQFGSNDVYCYRVRPAPDKARWRTCTTGPIPAPAVETEAKNFAPVAGAATLYVVRRSARDHSDRIAIQVNEGPSVETIPRSFARLRMPPGSHALSFIWRGVRYTQPMQLRAGEVRFLELNASGGVGGLQYEWEIPVGSIARDEAMLSRLVADLDLRS
jgi:hypothetical protein